MLFNLRIHVGLGAKSKPEFEPQRRKDATEIQEGHGDIGAEDRNLLYARIAQGNALAEAEEHARRQWGG